MAICERDHLSLPSIRGQYVLVGGAFDPLHEAHLSYFRRAQQWGPLLCALASDAELSLRREPWLPELTRLKILNDCRPITHVHLAREGIVPVLEAARPLVYVKGEEWQGQLPTAQVEACDRLHIPIRYVLSDPLRASDLLADYQIRLHRRGLEAFSQFVDAQQDVDPEQFDDGYFHAPWRGSDTWTFEERRLKEGPRPQLIKEIFAPSSVLDVGCGPGHLVRLLNEAGVVAWGVDPVYGRPLTVLGRPLTVPDGGPTSEPCILSGRLDDVATLQGFRPSDLVICREVLEHLSVRQIARAIPNLVRLSSRYVYATVRVNDRPRHFLDCVTQFDVDPTHVSCPPIDWLRMLFVLQGCRQRADLEARMDWQHNGHALVYEV